MEYQWLVLSILWLNHAYGHDYDLEDSEYDIIEEYKPPHYEFKYGVKDTETGDIKNQWEVRKGDNVKGGYSVVEPDGTIRKVQYSADKHSGFNAIVTREGKAKHPVKIIARPLPPQRPENLYYEPSFSSPKQTFATLQPKPVLYSDRVVNNVASESSKRVQYVSPPEVPPNHSPVYTGISNYNKLLQMYRKFREQTSDTRKQKFDYGINEYFENGYLALKHRNHNSARLRPKGFVLAN